MSGINDHPRNTGALPKSNRRRDKKQEVNTSTVNQNREWNDRTYRAPDQHPNNLFQFDWHTVSERLALSAATTTTTSARTAKNSNTRSTYSTVPATSSAYDLGDLGLPTHYNSLLRLYPNILLKMTPPVQPRTQSPANLPAKPTNTDKMPDRAQVESRLNQIREYIKITTAMMDSLSQSADPRAQAQREKLGRMVEDLYDSEKKLSKLLEECQKYWRINENGDVENGEDANAEKELRRKVEESQRKLTELQGHQAHLVGMQLAVRERLNAARKAQQALLNEEENEQNHQQQQQPQEENDEEDEDNGVRTCDWVSESGEINGGQPSLVNVEQLERETEVFRSKLQQLESKTRHMDQLVQELQAVEINERASCSGKTHREKTEELEAMKAQLAHLKALMGEATISREGSINEQIGGGSEPEHDYEIVNGEVVQPIPNDDTYRNGDNGSVNFDVNSHNDADEVAAKSKRPSVEQIQAVTMELKEQQQLLIAARAELQRLKQGGIASHLNPTPSVASTTSPPSVFIEKKQSNNTTSSNVARQARDKQSQLEGLIRKDQSHGLSVNQNGGLDWSSRRGSNSQHSHASTPRNLWPLPTNIASASHEQSVDGISAAENLLEVESQIPIENGFGGNFWGMPAMLTNQPTQGATVGSAEYYRQLLLGSQAQQLQMMSTTIQQCYQLLWSQQQEMQSMRTAITQLQAQVRHSQPRTCNNLDLHEDQHSNLGRATASAVHFGSVDATTLPPSSSLPNLVSLPSTSPAPVISTSANCPQQQQQQQQQLNNQVPPGNRANNYWDNFRSYSRQNLLSGSSKTVTDCAAGTSAHTTSSTNTASGVIISSHVNNKCNRQQGLDNLPMASSSLTSDVQYSLNLQLQQNSSQQQHQQLQQQQQDSAHSWLQNNCIPSSDAFTLQQQQVVPQQQQAQQQQLENTMDEAAAVSASYHPRPKQGEEKSSARIAKKITEREDLKLFLKRCLQALESTKQIESLTLSSNVSNSTDSSDDESNTGAPRSSSIQINQMPSDFDSHAPAQLITSPQHYFSEQGLFSDALSFENEMVSLPSASNAPANKDNKEDLVETDQKKRETSRVSREVAFSDEDNAMVTESEAARSVHSYIHDSSEISLDDEELNAEDDRVRNEYVMFRRPVNSRSISARSQDKGARLRLQK